MKNQPAARLWIKLGQILKCALFSGNEPILGVKVKQRKAG